MTLWLVADNAITTSAGAVSAGDSTLTVSTGTGELFPTPGAGQAFMGRIGSNTQHENFTCTSRTGDVFTLSAPLASNWPAGTTVILPLTATVFDNLVQWDEIRTDMFFACIKETVSPFCLVPMNVGSLWLAAGDYLAPQADIGCTNPAYAATLKFKKADGTVLATIGGSAGGLAWHTAAAGFTLDTAQAVDLTLESNFATAVALVRGVRINR